jgi:hypothetical protein
MLATDTGTAVGSCSVDADPERLENDGWANSGTPLVLIPVINSFAEGPPDNTPPKSDVVGSGRDENTGAPVASIPVMT